MIIRNHVWHHLRHSYDYTALHSACLPRYLRGAACPVPIGPCISTRGESGLEELGHLPAPPAPRGELTAEQLAHAQQVLDEYGSEVFDLVLSTATWYSDLRAVSLYSVHAALAAQAEGMACSLIFRLRPIATKHGERVDVRFVSGANVQLVLDFPH